MGATWDDPHYISTSSADRLLDRVFPGPGTARGRVSDPVIEAHRSDQFAHPDVAGPSRRRTVGGASRPTNPEPGTYGNGRDAHHRLDEGTRQPTSSRGSAASAGRAPHPSLYDRDTEDLVDEDSRGIVLGLTVALLALVVFVWAVTGCTTDPAESLWCADDHCEVAP